MVIYDIRANIRAHKSDMDLAYKDKSQWGRWSEIVTEACNEDIALAKQVIEDLERELAARLFQQAQLSLFGGEQ